MICNNDTYIIRDLLKDDIIFITSEEIMNNGNDYNTQYVIDVNSKLISLRLFFLMCYFLLKLD